MAKIADRLRQQTPRRADEVERGRRYVREAVGFEAGSASAVTLVYGTASSCREQRRVGLELAVRDRWRGREAVDWKSRILTLEFWIEI